MILSLLKGFDMVAMFSLVYIFGSIPIRSVLFKENRYPIEMACIQIIFQTYSEAFSGGLYISFAVIHLIPESAQSMDVLFQNKNHHFPISYLLVVLSFMLIMWVQKIAFRDVQVQVSDRELRILSEKEEEIKQIQIRPYIIQLAIGIHAFFEGLAIGILQDFPGCLAISIAVLCHKWAEGFTIGVAFRKANTDIDKAMRQILIQSFINPLGIGFGWILQTQGDAVTGFFQAISAGTFLYISCVELVNETFDSPEFQKQKLLFFNLGVILITIIWFIE